ncbi:chaperone protein dnaJ C76, chloroplastic [Camellia sinensis]|uniref:chaperone protein dnaJ C76, chloroplastic n=1 Tax=Camellia sinensis TaxID=4442 RepID=UPI0010355718|nr:chaperone protein dnaJ C76, chloroplastic [Camellia sinensis]
MVGSGSQAVMLSANSGASLVTSSRPSRLLFLFFNNNNNNNKRYNRSTPSFASLIITTKNPKTFFSNTSSFYTSTTLPTALQNKNNYRLTCRCSKASSPLELDLYDLLGVDSSSSQSQIKLAYRALQKRCHPDIAGPAGHDMAIILNDAYSLLSDPNSRFAYDKEQAKFSELRGYTGKPIYSVWFGAEKEERAVFVDEVKCVGCLKCALLAEKTFAVESVYGRARVVAQWADPENKIHEAIDACPVDCISVVERSNLAALEFLMSKQPRGNVRIGASNAVGTRVSNIFVDVEKFQARFQDAKNKASSTDQSTESDAQREARSSAIQAIRSISNWLYWHSPSAGGGGGSSTTGKNLIPSGKKSTEPNIKKLQEAAAARKHARENGKPISQIPSSYIYNDEYWIPSTLKLPEATTHQNISGSGIASESSRTTKDVYKTNNQDFTVRKDMKRNPFVWGIPMAIATVAAAIVRLQIQEGSSGRLEEHIGGSSALHIVNSSWLQVVLAGITWYLIGTYTVELVEAFRSKMGMYKK